MGNLVLTQRTTHQSDERLAAAVERNAAEWLPLLARLPWVKVHNEADFSWLYAGDAWPQNGVKLARFTAATADRRVGEVLRFTWSVKSPVIGLWDRSPNRPTWACIFANTDFTA